MGHSTDTSSDMLYSPLRLRLPWVMLMATIAVASSMATEPPVGPRVPHFDKLSHFFIFGLLGTLVFRSFRSNFGEWKRVWKGLAFVAAFGVVDEVLQSFNPNRFFDPLDWIADLSGGLVAILAYRSWARYRRFLEYPILGGLPK